MLKVAKKYFGLTSREILMGAIGTVWEDIPEKYKKEYNKKWGKQDKKIKKAFKKKK